MRKRSRDGLIETPWARSRRSRRSTSPHLPAIDGVRLAATAAGIRYPGRTDLLLALFDPGTTVAGVLTRSKTASAPVDWCRARLAHGMARALVVNSGNANAFTGKRGTEAVTLTAEAAAEAADCLEADVYIASTGVIGEPLDARKIAGALGALAREAQGRRLCRGGARHHDHRHLSQARHAAGRDRRGLGHHQRHRQGRRHDRARHGDHARLSLHRRRHRAAGAARFARPGRGRDLQRHHHRRRHLDQRHVADLRHGAVHVARRARGSSTATISDSRASASRCTR